MKNRPHRKRLRLPHHDYGTAGGYFVTVCTYERARLFGEVVDGEARLNEAGQMVRDAWEALPAHHPAVSLDAFVVMPDHLHGIVILRDAAPDRADLPNLMRRFKSFTTAQWRGTTRGRRLWQRGYHDRIVRDGDELHRIRRYVENNPQRWPRRTAGPPDGSS